MKAPRTALSWPCHWTSSTSRPVEGSQDMQEGSMQELPPQPAGSIPVSNPTQKGGIPSLSLLLPMLLCQIWPPPHLSKARSGSPLPIIKLNTILLCPEILWLEIREAQYIANAVLQLIGLYQNPIFAVINVLLTIDKMSHPRAWEGWSRLQLIFQFKNCAFVPCFVIYLFFSSGTEIDHSRCHSNQIFILIQYWLLWPNILLIFMPFYECSITTDSWNIIFNHFTRQSR